MSDTLTRGEGDEPVAIAESAVESSSGGGGFSRNALFTVFAWSIPAAASLIALPYTIRGLGPDAYGLMALVTGVTGYLGLMELGLGQAVLRYLAFYRALNQGRTVLAIVRVAVIWFAVAGVVGGLLMWFGATWLTESVLKVPESLWPTSETVIRVTSVNFLVGMLVSVGIAIPQGFLRYDISSLVTALLGTINAVAPAVLVSMGYGLEIVVWSFLIANLFALAIYSFFGARLLSTLDSSAGPPWRAIRRKVLSFAGITAVTKIHTVVAMQTSRIVVGIAGGTAEAAFYQVPNMLSSRVNDLLGRVAQILFPTGADYIARGDDQGLRALYFRSSRIFFLLNGTVTMAMCVFAFPLLEFWIDPTFADAGATALVVFTVTQCINAVTMAPSFLNLSSERPGVNLVFSLANSVISLAVVYPLTVRWGVTGAATAALLGATVVPLFMLYTNGRILHVSSFAYFRRCLLPTIIGSLVIGALAWWLLVPLCSRLLDTLALWSITIVAAMAASGLIGAVKSEDVRLARRLASSLRRS